MRGSDAHALAEYGTAQGERMKSSKIAILGAGSWGTAVAIHLAHIGKHVMLWGHNSQHIHDMIETRQNNKYLPDVMFPPTLQPNANLNACLKHAANVIIAVPSHAFRTLLPQLTKPLNGIAWLTKGIAPDTHQLLSQLVAEQWGEWKNFETRSRIYT